MMSFKTRSYHVVHLVLAVFILSTLTTADAQDDRLALDPAPKGVRFYDVATDERMGLDYRHRASAHDALFDALKSQESYGLEDLIDTPFESRGIPGVAIFDYDKDGDQDIYVTNSAGAANSLFANQLDETGALGFVDVALLAGVDATDQQSMGVCYGDTDNDGDHDLFVLGQGEANRFFENRGDGTFGDITSQSGLGGGEASSSSCAMGDVDGDGLLDIVVGNAFDMSTMQAIMVEPFALSEPNQLFLNRRGNVFDDVSTSSGFLELALSDTAPKGAATITWAVAMIDLDLDGDVDIVQADDQAGIPPEALGGVDRGYLQIFENDGGGQFRNITAERGLDRAGAWMGLAFADFDHNGSLDVFGSNMGNHSRRVFAGMGMDKLAEFETRWFFQHETGFADALEQGLRNTPFGWGASAVDYDNDADSDILYHGGLDTGAMVVAAPGVILSNRGQGMFRRDFDALAASTNHVQRTVHGVATGDLNNDGFVDVVSVSSFDMPQEALVPAPTIGGEFDVDAHMGASFELIDAEGFLFRWSGLDFADGSLSVELNSADNGNGFIQVETLGTARLTSLGRANRDGIGAVVQVQPEQSPAALQAILGGSSHASQDSLVATFGLGRADGATVEVLWPGGVRNRLYDVKAGERLVFPEIPCSFSGRWASEEVYRACVGGSLDELVSAGVLDAEQRARFLDGAMRAFGAP